MPVDAVLLDDIGEQSQFCHPDAQFTLSAFCYACDRVLPEKAVLAAGESHVAGCDQIATPSFSLPCEICDGVAHITLAVQYTDARGRSVHRAFDYYSNEQLLHHLELCSSAGVELSHLRQLRAHCPELMWSAHYRIAVRNRHLKHESTRFTSTTNTKAADERCVLRRPPSPVIRGGRLASWCTARSFDTTTSDLDEESQLESDIETDDLDEASWSLSTTGVGSLHAAASQADVSVSDAEEADEQDVSVSDAEEADFSSSMDMDCSN